jgi:hypothetical protein
VCISYDHPELDAVLINVTVLIYPAFLFVTTFVKYLKCIIPYLPNLE